jgi:hypothetical protein
MNTLESDLKHLPNPALPEGLSADIMARLANLDEEGIAGASKPARVASIKATRDRLAWTAALVGLTVGVGAQAYRLAVSAMTLDLTSLRISRGFELTPWLMDGVVEMLSPSPAVAVLAVGLLLYLIGLFAPLRRTAS